MKSNLLTIAIPTYNRELILDEALCDLIPKVRKYGIEILICDNASTDNTRSIVEKYAATYSYIKYFCQEVNIVDKNFVTCYELSNTKYVWLLGDSYRIFENSLDYILEILSSGNYEAVIINAFNRVKNIQSQLYDNPVSIIEDLGWHMGLLCSTIVSKPMVCEEMTRRYLETTFIQVGLFFEYLCINNQAKVWWISDNCIFSTKISKTSTSWLSRSFEIYGSGYMSFIFSLPSQIPFNSKLKCIKDHSDKVGFFEWRNLLYLRSNDWLNYKLFKQYRRYMPFLTRTPLVLLFLISIFPKSLLVLGNRLRKLFV